MLDENRSVNCHVVHALLRLMLDHVQQILRGQLLELFLLLHSLVDRHSSNRNRRCVDNRLANSIDVAASRQIHHSIGTVLHSHAELVDFTVDVG